MTLLVLLCLAVLAGYFAWWWKNGRKKGPADTQPVEFTPLADVLEKEESAKFENAAHLKAPKTKEKK